MVQPDLPESIRSLDWAVQIGPDIKGSAEGYVLSTSARFYVATQTPNPNETYAWYSTDATYPNNSIPNNEIKEVSGRNTVAWRYSVPDGVQIKFIMGAN